MSSAEAIKKPQTAYFLWMNASRERIQTLLGTKELKAVAAKASEMWKAASAAEKGPHEKEAKRQKDAYDAFVATPEGQKALQEKKAGKQEEKQAKQEKEDARKQKKEEIQIAREKRACNMAVKAIEKDERLKKPLTPYFAWLNDNRERICATLGTKNPMQVGAKASEMWKKLSEKEQKPYQDRHQKAKQEYEAYIQTPAGAAALKAYKDATSAAAYKEPVAETKDEEATAGQKRKIEAVAETAEPGIKKTRSAKAGA